MCGIIGLFIKTPAMRAALGPLAQDMLAAMTDRGPDSAGFALYRDPAPAGSVKLTLYDAAANRDWADLAARMGAALGVAASAVVRGDHGLITIAAGSAPARDWLARTHPDIRVMGHGAVMEVYKGVGLPAAIAARFDMRGAAGALAIGHTRMATESAVTTEGAHPFTAADDLCLVHNGSLSNYFQLRRRLEREGQRFATRNDSEVAAGYFAHKLAQGLPLEEALRAGFADLDGFYTFAIGARDGFAVVRDGIGCKPAQLAETEDWVAMASEFRALAHLPGVERARLWEPRPGEIYAWRLDEAQAAA